MKTPLSKLITTLLIIHCVPTHSDAQMNNQAPVDSLAMEVSYHQTTISVSASYFYKQRQNLSDSIYFTLNPGFKVDKISSPGLLLHKMTMKKGRPFPFMILKFDKALDGNPRRIDFEYTIDLEKVTQIKYDWIELMVDQFWFPNATDLDNKFVSHTVVKNLPADYMLYSYHAHHENPDHSYVIDERKPTPEIAFLAGKNMALKTKTTGRVQITYFTSTETSDSTLNSLNKKMVDIISLYNTTFGKSKPVNKFAIALRKFPRKLLNSQTTRDGLVITGVDFDNYGNFAHEFGHFWWSDASFLREPWLNESFANFSMMKALRKFDPVQADKSYNLFKRKLSYPDQFPLWVFLILTLTTCTIRRDVIFFCSWRKPLVKTRWINSCRNVSSKSLIQRAKF